MQSAQIIVDRDTNRSKGFGFVEMGSDAEAQAAIQGLNGHDHDGRNLTVNEAKPREARAGGGGYGGGRSGGGGGYGGGRRWRRRRWRWLWRRWRSVLIARRVTVFEGPARAGPSSSLADQASWPSRR